MDMFTIFTEMLNKCKANGYVPKTFVFQHLRRPEYVNLYFK